MIVNRISNVIYIFCYWQFIMQNYCFQISMGYNEPPFFKVYFGSVSDMTKALWDGR